MRVIKVLVFVLVLSILAGCGGQSATTGSYQNMTVDELKKKMDDKDDFFLVDVHTPEQQHIKGTDAFVPFDQVTENADKFPKDKDTTIIVYCRSGNMSVDASQDLVGMGYKNVFNVLEGINAWNAKGYPLN